MSMSQLLLLVGPVAPRRIGIFDLSLRGCYRVDARLFGRSGHRMRHNGAVVAASAPSRVVVIVVFDQVTLLDVAGAAEVFAEANRFGGDYHIKIASVDGREVATSIGTG